jgi:hypothetical protein
MNEDYTAGVLKGIPLFCINRIYKVQVGPTSFTKVQYLFDFDNDYNVSIVEFINRDFSSGHQYEMMINIPGTGGNPIERGDEKDMHRLLTNVEQIVLSNNIKIKSIDNVI